MAALDRVKSETGREVIFAVNVTASPANMVRMAETAKAHRG